MKDKKTIKYISNVPVPYENMMLNELEKKCSVKVIFEAETYVNHNKDYYDKNLKNFKYIYLKNGHMNIWKPSFKVVKYINKNQDLLIIGGYSEATLILAILYAKLFRIPYCLRIDGALRHEESFFKHQVKKILINGADTYLSSGETGDEFLCSYGVTRSRIYRYYFSSLSAADILEKPVSAADKKMLKKKLGLEDKPTIISIGRYVYIDKNGNESPIDAKLEGEKNPSLKLVKGFDVLIKAFSKLSDKYQLIIIGGEPNAGINALVKRLGLKNIKFINFLPKDKVFEYYQASDLFCLQTRGDSWGLVINEAMANGLPVITTKKCVAGINLIEDNENGFLIDPEDYNDLALKMDTILSDENVKKRMSQNNLEKIKPYTIEDIANTCANLASGRCVPVNGINVHS